MTRSASSAPDSAPGVAASELASFYRHLVEHDLIAAHPAAAVRRPTVDLDHTTA